MTDQMDSESKTEDTCSTKTSSLDNDFVPQQTIDEMGHRLTSQQSASKAFDTLGLIRKS